jgi:RNA polymerase sigma-70 factor (ECF subfamily)
MKENAGASADAHRAIEAVWKIESVRLIAGLSRSVRDVGLAEELASDALVAALEQWPQTGVPQNPGAWLMAIAKRRGIDTFRRSERSERKAEALGRELESRQQADEARRDDALDDNVGGDNLLRLVFIACHPVLSTDARVALTLRLIGGLTTEEIARAFLAPPATIAQRVVRAKRTLSEARVPFEMPHGADRAARLSSVLEVVYLIFNEGYAATAGDDSMRPALCYDALRLGRVLAELTPEEPEVHGLVALMEIQTSRARARVNGACEPVRLIDQDRSRWDRILIRRGLEALARAERLSPRGPYALQAAIAACHARAHTPEQTDWARIVELYDELTEVAPSAIVALNRAVAVSMASGPAAGLEAVEALESAPLLKAYHLLPAVRGDLLERLGRFDEARVAYERAATLTQNATERRILGVRAATCAHKAATLR